nr:hypothetical protein [Tanacetum cinerariifolium]
MKKLRSKLPRRKRSNFSPVLKSSPKKQLFTNATSSIITNDVTTISCDSSTNNNKIIHLKKRTFNDVTASDVFRRITRSYTKRFMESSIVSESSSCVDLANSSSKNVVTKGYDADLNAKSECSVFPLTNAVKLTEENDVVSEVTSLFPVPLVDDVVSVSSRSVSPVKSTANEGESAYVKVNDDVSGKIMFNYGNSNSETVKSVNDEQNNDINEGESAYVKVKVNDDVTGTIKFNYGNNSDAVKTVDNNCGESKLIPVDLDLTCSERLSDGYDDVEDEEDCTDANMYSCSEIDFSSEFASSWYESGSQFSEMSVGDTAPSPTFMLFMSYREMFCKSEFSRRVLLTGRDVNEASERIVNLLRPEDEEHEESYWMLKLRERRQLYVHDYSEEYCEMKEYGDLVVKQRLQMVHWIMEQAANKELQKETMFLGVSLLDRFLSKGYFRNKRELEIAGIACLTLATRIEENQPYNSIREKIFYVGNVRYSRSQVVAMEWLVQEVLNFQCYLPTIYNFLWFYLKAARADEDVDKIAKYLAVLALLGHEQLCYWPSTVAASLVILACLAENKQSTCQQITWIYDGSNDKDLPNCVKCLEWMLKCIT